MPGLPQTSEMTALVGIAGSADTLAAAIDGRAMISRDGGRTWSDAGFGGADAPVDMIATDVTWPQRIWAAARGGIVVSDDLGSSWHSVGRSLPEPKARVRGIAASADVRTLVVSSGLWNLSQRRRRRNVGAKRRQPPDFIEAGPLARDPKDAGVIYAVFSLMPYAEVWRMAVEGGNLLARIEPISLAGALSFCVLVLVGELLPRRVTCHADAVAPIRRFDPRAAAGAGNPKTSRRPMACIRVVE